MLEYRRLCSALMALFVLSVAPFWVAAQGTEAMRDMKARVGELLRNKNYAEAVPLLERIAAAEPEDGQTQFYLGFALLNRAATLTDAQARRQDRARARQALEKAKKLDYSDPLLDGLLASIPPDGSEPEIKGYSSNKEADRLMREGEAAFASGQMDEALKKYQQALQLDPNIYEAALFSGDVFLQKGEFAKAEEWYQKAIKINPERETAWRYSATPLMRQRKLEQARERYVEAFICEPYNSLARRGLVQWGQIAGVRLAHPDIRIPASVTGDGKGKVSITLGLGDAEKDDGTFVWTMYGIVRATWQTGKDGKLSDDFKKAYPNEKVYRHSLAEEYAALRMAVEALKGSEKKPKQLDPSLARLVKLHDAGLLEAYILLARPDEGIARDHPAYLKANRDKLRRYVVEYVLTGGEGV